MHQKGAAKGDSSTHAWHGGLHHTGRHEEGHAGKDFRAVARMQKEKQKDDPHLPERWPSYNTGQGKD